MEKRIAKPIETFGKIAGAGLRAGNVYLEQVVRGFELNVTGQHHLTRAAQEPCIVAGNHEQPEWPWEKGPSLEKSKLSPDSYVVRKVFSRVVQGRKLWFVGHYNNPDAPTISPLDVFFKGVYKGHGVIPLVKQKGHLNRDMVQGVRHAFAKGDSILMYPEGKLTEDFDPNGQLFPGTASVAKRYNRPIIPFYIRGSRQWKMGQRVDIAFGEPINPQGKTKEQITEELRGAITQLQQQTRQETG